MSARSRLLAFGAGVLVGLELGDARAQVADRLSLLRQRLRESIEKLDAANACLDDLDLKVAECASRLDRLHDERRNRVLVGDESTRMWRDLVATETADSFSSTVPDISKVHGDLPSSVCESPERTTPAASADLHAGVVRGTDDAAIRDTLALLADLIGDDWTVGVTYSPKREDA